MQVCISSDVSGLRKPPLKRDVIALGAGHLRDPIQPTDGMPRQGLLCDAFAAFVRATTVLSGVLSRASSFLHDLVDGPVRLSLGKTTGMKEAGRRGPRISLPLGV